MIDLRLGRWEDVLADVGEVDHLICDPPYSEQTHQGHDAGSKSRRDGSATRPLDYQAWTVVDVHRFVEAWAHRVRGWCAVLTDYVLAPAWRGAYHAHGLYDFAPVPCIIRGMTVRLCGDGPSSWAVYLVVARQRTLRMSRWGTLPGWYEVPHGGGRGTARVGGKPIQLMRAIVGDYTDPGDLVVDPCAGHATTLLAAREVGVKALGAEVDVDTHRRATEVIARPWQTRSHPRTPVVAATQIEIATTGIP